MPNTAELLVEQNVAYLERGLDILATVNDDDYTAVHRPYHESSIGDHLRHCLEHYVSFLDGYSAGSVDYDARARDKRIATQRIFATATIQNLIARLRELPAQTLQNRDRSLHVKMDCGGATRSGVNGSTEESRSGSSVERELQYLLAHTVHHYALIAILLRLQGYMPADDLGVAPSTITFRKRVSTTS